MFNQNQRTNVVRTYSKRILAEVGRKSGEKKRCEKNGLLHLYLLHTQSILGMWVMMPMWYLFTAPLSCTRRIMESENAWGVTLQCTRYSVWFIHYTCLSTILAEPSHCIHTKGLGPGTKILPSVKEVKDQILSWQPPQAALTVQEEAK